MVKILSARAYSAVVAIDRMIIYAYFAIIVRQLHYCIKLSRTVSPVLIIRPFYSHLFAIAKLTFTRTRVSAMSVIVTLFFVITLR